MDNVHRMKGVRTMRRTKAVMAKLLLRKSKLANSSANNWERMAMCANSLEDCEQYLKWAERDMGEADGYWLASALFTDDEYFAENCKLHEMGDI